LGSALARDQPLLLIIIAGSGLKSPSAIAAEAFCTILRHREPLPAFIQFLLEGHAID
jgi:hypothetical protein